MPRAVQLSPSLSINACLAATGGNRRLSRSQNRNWAPGVIAESQSQRPATCCRSTDLGHSRRHLFRTRQQPEQQTAAPCSRGGRGISSAAAELPGHYFSTTLALPRHYHGTTMVLLRYCHGTTAVLLQHYFGTTTALLRHYCGTTAALPRHCSSTTAAPLRHYCGTTTVLLRYYCGTTAVLLR